MVPFILVRVLITAFFAALLENFTIIVSMFLPSVWASMLSRGSKLTPSLLEKRDMADDLHAWILLKTQSRYAYVVRQAVLVQIHQLVSAR